MVLLSDSGEDTTAYLTSTGLPALLEAAIKAFGEEREHRLIKSEDNALRLRGGGCGVSKMHSLPVGGGMPVGGKSEDMPVGGGMGEGLDAELAPAERETLAAEAEAIMATLDADGDGSVSMDELRAHMRQRGATDEQIATLFKALDENNDGMLSREEMAVGLRRLHTGEPALKQLMAASAPPEGVDFADLASAPGGCFRIVDTAQRAITLEQLERILRHVAGRMGCELKVVKNYGVNVTCKRMAASSWRRAHLAHDGERWLGSRQRAGRFTPTSISFDEVNLYDTNKYVIGPATAAPRCSMVELMASEEQPPDYFVSHFWAEPILDFFKCLLVHSWARRLEEKRGYHNGQEMGGPDDDYDAHPLYLGGRSPRYWVCAHANNQHDLASELVTDLAQTSFARALRSPTTKGAVSVVDSSAGCYGRIWCVYELYRSLVGSSEGYTYDMVTATEWDQEKVGRHGAVAITDGLSAQQYDADQKREQEEAFPLELLEAGIRFLCLAGQASVEKDRERIVIDIGNQSNTLDATVHGVVASGALRRALEAGGPRAAAFLEAVRHGHVRKLQLALQDSNTDRVETVDTVETWLQVVGALDTIATKELSMQTGLQALPGLSFGRLTSLTSIDMRECGVTSLPEGLFGGLTSLTSIDMSYSYGLTSLPEGLFGGLTALTSINMSYCWSGRVLTSLPGGLFDGLTSLTSINMRFCSTLDPPAVSLLEDLAAKGVKVMKSPLEEEDDEYESDE